MAKRLNLKRKLDIMSLVPPKIFTSFAEEILYNAKEIGLNLRCGEHTLGDGNCSYQMHRPEIRSEIS